MHSSTTVTCCARTSSRSPGSLLPMIQWAVVPGALPPPLPGFHGPQDAWFLCSRPLQRPPPPPQSLAQPRREVECALAGAPASAFHLGHVPRLRPSRVGVTAGLLDLLSSFHMWHPYVVTETTVQHFWNRSGHRHHVRSASSRH